MRGRVFTNQRVTATHTVCRLSTAIRLLSLVLGGEMKQKKVIFPLVTRLTSVQYLRWPCLKSGQSGGGGGRGIHETTLALHSIACIEFCAKYGNMILIRHYIVNVRRTWLFIEPSIKPIEHTHSMDRCQSRSRTVERIRNFQINLLITLWPKLAFKLIE